MAQDHHYLPRFYLRGFIDPIASAHDQKVWVFENALGTWQRLGPKKVGFVPDLYATESAKEEEKYVIENLLEFFETKTAPIIQKVSRKETLVGDDRRALASFVALMMNRVPSRIEHMASQEAGMLRWMLESTLQHPSGMQVVSKACEEAGHEVPADVTREDLLAYLQQVEIHIKKDHKIQTMLGLSDACLEQISQMNWSFLHVNDEQYFITSDRPCTMMNDVRKPELYAPGLGDEDIQVVFPLCATICLLMSWNNRFPEHEVISPARVDIHNFNRLIHSDKIVVSPMKNFFTSAKYQNLFEHGRKRRFV